MAAIAERTYVSQFSSPVLGLKIHAGGVLSDPDGDLLTMTLSDSEGVIITSRAATRESEGVYSVTLSSIETQNLGIFTLGWAWSIAATPEIYRTYIEIGPASPVYDALLPEYQGLIEGTYEHFADLFDSPEGGPHLQAYFQTGFGRNRIAGLLEHALRNINLVAAPHSTYTLDGPNFFPMAEWGGVLEQSLLVEVISHLRRSYTEQPSPQGINQARLDRRDYFDRWGTILREEQATLKGMLDLFKISHMGLGGNVGVLVSGGVFGRYGPINRAPGVAAARGYYWGRYM